MYRNAYIDLASDRAMEFSTRQDSVVGAAMAYAHGLGVYDDSSEPSICENDSSYANNLVVSKGSQEKRSGEAWARRACPVTHLSRKGLA
jgi:hypothetical protein